jgi:hypothetical protein
MAAMLSRLSGRGCQVRETEDACAAGGEQVDPVPDSDSDLDGSPYDRAFFGIAQ